ncbi:hypothetical protein [Glycomyces tarimensis]
MNMRSGATYDGRALIDLVWQLVRDEAFDPREFVLAGSARLWREGCIPRLSDLDLVAIGRTWDRAWELGLDGTGEFGSGSLNMGKTVLLFGGRIEVSNAWIPPYSDPHRLIECAEIIDELRYPTIAAVVDYKRAIGRPKDLSDLEAFARYRSRMRVNRRSEHPSGGAAAENGAAALKPHMTDLSALPAMSRTS